MSYKNSLSVWCDILRLFVKALTGDDKFYGSNMQNLPQEFQTPASQKQKTFLYFLLHFWNVHQNLEHFKEKDDYPSLIISEIIDAERRGHLNV